MKLFGLRVDPCGIEEQLRRSGVKAYCVGADREVVVAATGGHRPERVRRPAADGAGLPTCVVRAHVPADLPRLANSKPDLVAARALTAPPPTRRTGTDQFCRIYAELLDQSEGAVLVHRGAGQPRSGGHRADRSVRRGPVVRRLPGFPQTWFGTYEVIGICAARAALRCSSV
ncbi:hypothetical protein [Micromonospora sp. CB01531]|uniref:hypothetical protein n=1 Tax=Micromonospora sp. CB01531 TaxID=1718947 RepID=UPI00093C1239|nr:hypothetical protein [Micromonospora sp. CB01531]OKI46416.1 hypothetical protein A6A27_37050 [Micromonospora sp. CB01531]